MMYTYNLITIYKIIYYNFIVISYILYLHIIHKKFLYMSPRKLTWISKMTPYLLPEIHFFQNRTCLFVFFKIFRGLIYIMYIYIYMYLSTASTGSLSIQLRVIKLQSPTTPGPVHSSSHLRATAIPRRAFYLGGFFLGNHQTVEACKWVGFFPPYPNWKKMLFKLKHMSSCLFPFLKVRVFCVFFLCFEEFLWKHRSLSKPTKLSFLKKGRSIGVKFSNKIWVHSVGGQHRNTLGWRLGGFFQEDFHHWSSPKTHFEPGKWKKKRWRKGCFCCFLVDL